MCFYSHKWSQSPLSRPTTKSASCAFSQTKEVVLGNNSESTRRILSDLQTTNWMTTGYDVTMAYSIFILYMSSLVLRIFIHTYWKLYAVISTRHPSCSSQCFLSNCLMFSVTGHRQYWSSSLSIINRRASWHQFLFSWIKHTQAESLLSSLSSLFTSLHYLVQTYTWRWRYWLSYKT